MGGTGVRAATASVGVCAMFGSRAPMAVGVIAGVAARFLARTGAGVLAVVIKAGAGVATTADALAGELALSRGWAKP